MASEQSPPRDDSQLQLTSMLASSTISDNNMASDAEVLDKLNEAVQRLSNTIKNLSVEMKARFRQSRTEMRFTEQRLEDVSHHLHAIAMTELRTFDEQLSYMDEHFDFLQDQIHHLQVLTADFPDGTQPALPTPDKLVDRNHVPQWLQQMIAKIRIDGHTMGSAETRFFYVYGCLGSEAQGKVLHVVQGAEQNRTWDLHSLYSAIVLCYQPDEATAVNTAWSILDRHYPA
ncbi:hypothetical protein F4805DRAFT_201291 [Annulohypoxylon moriforme]|nr:hypothetical protein F4805DRAFT_201291 [Annulohypoxylon moriforme]